MNEEDKQKFRIQQEQERWAEVKHWIKEDLCIGCGGDPAVKLYVHFCTQCLYDAGVQILFVEPTDGSVEHPRPAVAFQTNGWEDFMRKLSDLKDSRTGKSKSATGKEQRK